MALRRRVATDSTAAMGHIARHARSLGAQLRSSVCASSAASAASDGARGWELGQAVFASGRGFATSGHSGVLLRQGGLSSREAFSSCNEEAESCAFLNLDVARKGAWSLRGFGNDYSVCFSRRFSSNAHASSSIFPTGIQAKTTGHGLGFRQLHDLRDLVERCRKLLNCGPPRSLLHSMIAVQRSPVRGERGFAKAVALPPQMQKPMKLRVYMGSPGVIGEPWKPLPPPLPFWRRWCTKEGWKTRKQNVQGMLKTGFTLAKIRQKTKDYSQTKFYRDASDLYKEINSALAAGDRSALRQLVTDNVLTTMKKELKHREQAWPRVHWELVGPLKTIRTLQGRLIGIDQKNMDTAFAQLTLRIISHQKFAAYDKQGKLVAGDPEKELTVEDIWVFERQISHPELRWKLCGRLSV